MQTSVTNWKLQFLNIENFNRTEYHFSNLCFGMSIKAAINLMKKKNYYFIGTNLMRTNVFFISKDYSKEEYFPKNRN